MLFQGILSFWRGNGTAIIRYIPLQAFNFSFNDYYKHLISKLFTHDTPLSITVSKFVAGGLAGASSCFLVYPLDFCQTRLVTDVGAGKYHSSLICVDPIIHHNRLQKEGLLEYGENSLA